MNPNNPDLLTDQTLRRNAAASLLGDSERRWWTEAALSELWAIRRISSGMHALLTRMHTQVHTRTNYFCSASSETRKVNSRHADMEWTDVCLQFAMWALPRMYSHIRAYTAALSLLAILYVCSLLFQ